jgi:hypothetical protein
MCRSLPQSQPPLPRCVIAVVVSQKKRRATEKNKKWL